MALPRLSAISFGRVWIGAKADVRLSPDAEKQYREAIENKDELSTKRRTHLQRYFREFCDHDDYLRRLSDQKFKKEGNFSDGLGGTVAIYTIKAWQWRVYGTVMTVGGRRCFVGVVVDPTKKQDRADRAKLTSAAKMIAQLSEYHE
jgi:hypothetical protein